MAMSLQPAQGASRAGEAGLTAAGAARGCVLRGTAQTQPQQAQPQALCHPPAPAGASLLLTLLGWEAPLPQECGNTAPSPAVTLELGGGVRLMC